MNQPQQKNPMDARTVIAAALIVSAIGALFYNVLPLYLGVAQDYRGLDNQQIGLLSSAFFLGYNIITISAFFWIRKVAWTTLVAVATPIAAMSLYAGTLFPGYLPLLAMTVIAGGAFAALYGIGTVILGDTSNPGRWYGVKIAAEAFAGAILLLVLPATAIAKWGFEGTVIGIVIFMAFLSPFLFWIPREGNKGHVGDETNSSALLAHSSFIWGTLLATLLLFSGASAMWAFVERIGAQSGYDAEVVGVLLSVTLISAMLGSILAAVVGGRFGNTRPFLAGAVVFLAGLFFLGHPDVFMQYAAGACLLTFAIGFMLPIAVTEIAELDFDGRYIVLSVPAIGIGAMIGPGIAGVLTQSGNFLPLLTFGAGALILSTILLAVAGAKARSDTGVSAGAEK
jgi:predicted MFS family arabinose efflux permease